MLGPSGSWPVIPAPAAAAGDADEDATRPLRTSTEETGISATTTSGLPSRAARGPAPAETSILAGPSFDGFAVPPRPGREEETEAFHPGSQSPVHPRPRHAAPNEAPASAEERESDGPPRSRFQPMAPQPPVEAADATPASDGGSEATTVLRVPAADGEATTRFEAPPAADAVDPEATAKIENRPRGDKPSNSPWAEPPRERG
ncbi:hypothetical protein AB0M46_09595 [Dactylosporangium sp. NPDC051485]|uniref:hypothetical protein n=1 Tax=Dactylosporangium sp. NPDC051485 TaxID=3154846 RepID=UPI00342EF80D